MNKTESGVIILGGGNSERMGFPKQHLLYDNQKTFLEKIINEYLAAGYTHIVYVENSRFAAKNFRYNSGVVTRVLNYFPEKGRLYSIRLGLRYLPDCRYCFIQNVDNPFVDKELIELLAEAASDKGYTLPVKEGRGGHPVVLSKPVIEKITENAEQAFSLRELLNQVERSDVITAREDVLININTPEEYKKYFPENGAL